MNKTGGRGKFMIYDKRQGVTYPIHPSEWIGRVIRPAAFPSHTGWLITSYRDDDSLGIRGAKVSLTSAHNGETHQESWGVVCQLIRSGAVISEGEPCLS